MDLGVEHCDADRDIDHGPAPVVRRVNPRRAREPDRASWPCQGGWGHFELTRPYW